ncbi:MAG TPA: segregation/condensation protein A [Acidimicrobiales bacterium]
MPYEVRTPVFEGPFDLLLHLITSQQVDLYEVRISHIVDAYLTELERMEALDLDVATEFALIAATLIELKCRRLLPGRDDVEVDEELAVWEERDLLLARLLECKTFKDAASVLVEQMHEASRSLPRTAGPDERFLGLTPDVLAGVGPTELRDAFIKATAARPRPKVDLTHVPPARVSVGEAVDELAEELPALGTVTFRNLTVDLAVPDVIVRFLALLELYKQGRVDLDQGAHFGDLSIAWLADPDPVEPVMAVMAGPGGGPNGSPRPGGRHEEMAGPGGRHVDLAGDDEP